MSTSTVTASQADTTTSFERVRMQLADSGGIAIADKLDHIAHQLSAAGASGALRRLRQLDLFVGKAAPEALVRLIDVDRALDEVQEAEQRQARKYIGRRNVLALLPLFLTWWALAWATLAYQQELAASPQLVVQPFLKLWEERFGGRLFFLGPSFFLTACLDFIMVLGIIGYTIRAQRAEKVAASRGAQLGAELDDALADLTAALEATRVTSSSSPKDWAAAVQKVIDRAMQQTRELATANQRTVENATALLTKIESTHEQFVRDLARQTTETLGQAREQHAALIERSADRLEEMYQKASVAHQELGTANREMVASARDIMQQVRADVQDMIKNLAEEARQTLVAVRAENQAIINDTAQQAVNVLKESTNVLRTEMSPLLERFGATLHDLSADLTQYKDSSAAFVSTVTGLRDAATSLSDSARASAAVVDSIDRHLQGINQTQGAFAAQLSGAALDMRTASENVQTLATHMQQDLTNSLKALNASTDKAASNLVGATTALSVMQNSMHAAAHNLENAAEKFRHIPTIRVIRPWLWFGNGRQ